MKVFRKFYENGLAKKLVHS